MIESDVQGLKSKFEKTCDFFQIEPKSELRESTTDFFLFFKKFTKEIEESIPKMDRRRAGAPSVGGRAGAAQAALHAEMMKKLQQDQANK